MSFTPSHLALVALTLMSPAAPHVPGGTMPSSPSLVLSYAPAMHSHDLLAPMTSDVGFRVMPEKEWPITFEVGLESIAQTPAPIDIKKWLPRLEASLRLDLVASYPHWVRPEAQQAALDAGMLVPFRLERLEARSATQWAHWRLVPDFSGVKSQGTKTILVVSISLDLVRELADPAASPEALVRVMSDRLLDVGPARSQDEIQAREVTDIMQAEEAGDWLSLQRHAVALLALDGNSVFGHAFLARALTEQGKQAEAEIEMARAETLLANKSDSRLVAASARPSASRSTEAFMARALCPVLTNATPPRTDAPRCNPGMLYNLGW